MQRLVLLLAFAAAGAKEVRFMIFDNEGHGVFQSQRLLTFDVALGR